MGMSRSARVIVGAATTILLGVMLATPAAAVDRPGPNGSTPTRAELNSLLSTTALTSADSGPGATTGGATTLGVKLGVNPNGCTGQTDDPHKSGINASVHGSTRCTLNSQNLSVATILYRDDWWGLNYMNSGDAHRATGTMVEATPHSSCDYAPSRTYWGFSSHTVTVNGTLYSANTSNGATFACNY